MQADDPAAGLAEMTRDNEDLTRSLATLRSMIDSSSDAIIANDLNGIITSWNAGAAHIFGYTADETIGTSITRLIPSPHQGEMNDILLKIKRGERVAHYETQRLTKDGRLIDVSVTASPIKDVTGKIIGASKVSRDISDERHAARELGASEVRYRRLFESAQDGILILDAETGVVVDVNPFLTSLLGFSHREFVGKTIWDLGFFKDIVANEHNFSQLKEKGYLRYDNLPLEAADGRRIEVEFISNVYLVDGARVIQCSVRDVTARRRAEEAVRLLTADLEERVMMRTAELQATNKELEAFSYSVSHDLRAPLRAVDGFAQAVLEDFGSQLPAEGRRYLMTIRDGTQRMGTLIDDLLTFSRLGRAPLNTQKVDTGALVRGVIADLHAEQAGRQIDIRIGELPFSQGDPALLRQVWINLLSNALKFTRRREHAVVEIGSEPNPQGAVYFVRDNGTGFDMRYEGKLFGVFQRLHRSEEFEGTGVGLAIVQRIINRHGGRIWVQSAVDCGTTFYFSLAPDATT
jgi:PAS domain S-box-containing protein